MIGDIKHIIVIESLDSEKDGIIFTGETLYNDFIKRHIELYEKNFTHRFHRVNSKLELNEIFSFYKMNIPYLDGGIVFHLEIHGDNEKKGLVLSNGELVEWEELSNLLRPINILACNKVFLTLGVCNGRFFYKGVDPYKKTPYSGFISASVEVSPENIYNSFGYLFEILIKKGNIVEAYLEMEELKSNFYYKDSKRVFEEGFKVTMDNMRNDPSLKRTLLKDAIAQTERKTGAKLKEEEADYIFNLALKDIYDKQLEAFNFTDCK